MPETLRIATRKSPLARKQAALARDWLAAVFPDTAFEEILIKTEVDRRLQWSLEQRGGIGLFTKELEEALLDGRADIAVHSAKDLPTAFQNDLRIAGYLPRARAHDVFVRRAGADAPRVIASGSPRRCAQAALLYPEAEWTTLRGNVATRMGKIADGHADATLLAAAGLDRLGIESRDGLEFQTLSFARMVPAPGQGAIALQCRPESAERLEGLFCAATGTAVSLERAFLRRLGGGCQTPVGAHFDGATFHCFHPDTGYAAFPLAPESADAIDAALDPVFAQLAL